MPVLNLQIARISDKQIGKKEASEYLFGIDSANADISKSLFQSPWAKDVNVEDNYMKMLKQIHELKLDVESYQILTMLEIVRATSDFEEPVLLQQKHVEKWLKNHLRNHFGKEDAVKKLEECKNVHDLLKGMSRILAKDRIILQKQIRYF